MAGGKIIIMSQVADGDDLVTLEIIRGKLLATVDEMGIVISRTSMSPVIYEVLDFINSSLSIFLKFSR